MSKQTKILALLGLGGLLVVLLGVPAVLLFLVAAPAG